MPDAEPPPIPSPRHSSEAVWRVGGKLGAFLLMLAPAPAAWLLMTANESVGTQLYGELTSSQPGFYPAVCFILFALLSCVAGAIKLLGGFEKGGWRIVAGVMLGLMFLVIEWFAVFLAACAAGSSH